MVIAAYRGRCAISGVPEPVLLDAAHIAQDKDEQYGQPVVVNGASAGSAPLSKIHHPLTLSLSKGDAHLLGIDPDSRIHVSEKLLSLNDGPQLEALRQFNGKILLPPRRAIDKPDRHRLARRFEMFTKAA